MNYKTSDIIQLCLENLSGIYGTAIKLNHSQAVGGGCINQAVKLNTSLGDFFLKWNSSGPADLFQCEAEGLNEMQLVNYSGLRIPNVIWSKTADEWPGLILLEFLKPPKSIDGFEEQLGRGIAQLHRKSSIGFGFHHSNYCGTTLQDNTWNTNWPEFYARQRIWALVQAIRSSRRILPQELNLYERLVNRIPLLIPKQTVPSLIHGDLWSGNFMYTNNGPALIDPACYYADREMELGMMQLFGGFSPAVWDAYQHEFPLPGDWKERIRLYQLYHILNHYLLFGGSYGRQALEIVQEYL